MQNHELDTIVQVYEKLASTDPLDEKMRAYLVGKLEQLLAPYRQEAAEPRKLTDIFKKF